MVGVNTSVLQPPFPIAVRPKHIAATETNLTIEPKCDDHSPEDYIVKDSDGSTVFTVAGKKHGKRSGREFCDGSGTAFIRDVQVNWDFTTVESTVTRGGREE